MSRLGVIGKMTYRDAYSGCLKWRYEFELRPDGSQGVIRAEYLRIVEQIRELGLKYGIKVWRISRIELAIYRISHKTAVDETKNAILESVDKEMGWSSTSGETRYHLSPEEEREYLF
jgi:hypothetical protein